jgi:hypothetical protein
MGSYWRTTILLALENDNLRWRMKKITTK